MQKTSFHRGDTPWFSEQHARLVYQQESFGTYITEGFSKDAIKRQVERKSAEFTSNSRETIVEALEQQYDGVQISDQTRKNIQALRDENTFTITTGHQLSLFTGPLYFVIKILHVIKMCEELNAESDGKKFVPVYWMASEDHDFEEIQSLNIFNKKITWESEQKGPVGLFDTTGLDEIRVELHEFFANNPEGEIHEVIDTLQGQNYASAMRNLVNRLFGERGLVILDGDDASLKKAFLPIIERELKEEFSVLEVRNTTVNLVKDGGKDQVMPREINLFYMEKGLRSRIEADGGNYKVEGKGTFSLAELLAEPEKISPNVILRPLYQEYILPNIAYVGGGGEIAYWLQLKGVFKNAGVVYPLIQVRNSIVWMDHGVMSKLEKIEASVDDIFKDEDVWKKEFVKETEGDDLDMSAVDNAFAALSNELESLVTGIDPSKEQFVKAELARMEKQIDSIKSKAIKFSKSNHEQAMKAIEFIKSRINPDGGLQERTVNFFQFCNSGEVESRIQFLYDALEPFNGDLIVLMEKS